MKSLDKAVQKFKALKSKLQSISQQVIGKSGRKPIHYRNKQNNQNLQNKMTMSIPTPLCMDESKIQTQKKCKNKHKRVPSNYNIKNSNNLSFSSRMAMSYRVQDQLLGKGNKLTSLNNSRTSLMSYMTEELKEKEKTLAEINKLLEKKKQVLETIDEKIGNVVVMQGLKYGKMIPNNRKMIKAPNLFQMQIQGRKRSGSISLVDRWKGL